MNPKNILLVVLTVGLVATPFLLRQWFPEESSLDANNDFRTGRSEVVFWHFWGGADRDVVDDVVNRFNASQEKYFVRAVAMPGNNLQAKLFLSVAGEDPPDVVNQDDPILADWAERGIIMPLDEIKDGTTTVDKIRETMFESAKRLSIYNDRMYGVCNGLDIRALYYNKTALEKYGLAPPKTIDELDEIAETISPPDTDHSKRESFAYLPDSRRLWAWGYVFGGQFLDSSGRVSADSSEIVEALGWMQSFSRRYGADNLAAFRTGDQSLPGKTFPLLPIDSDSQIGRYAMVMDGQWRTRDINAFSKKRKSNNKLAPEFGVCPLPQPINGKTDAGWVNGNFFVVPRGSRNSAGALEFMKFWVGIENPNEAAKTCVAGGWIPVSQAIVDTPTFQNHLQDDPLFAEFVRLASSPNQHPVPQIPGAAMFRRTIESAAAEAMTNPSTPASDILKRAGERIQTHLDRIHAEFDPGKDRSEKR